MSPAVAYAVAVLDDELASLERERRTTTLPVRRHDIGDEITEKLDQRLQLVPATE